MSQKQRGFSLVELMVTVSIIGVAGLAAAPSMLDVVPKYRVDGAAKTLASEMQLVRMRAVARNRIHYVTFDATAQTITVQEEDPGGARQTVQTLQLDSQFPNVSLGYHGVTAPDGSGVISQAASFGAGGAEATFFPTGVMAESGFFYVLPTTDVAATRNDRMRAVQVGLAGQVVVLRYTGTSPLWEEL
ncbi:MAG: prepilin-type N-terminal cleavage/methylation domain-containing protein [Deltaproteobacteria bacterium]|nr:prepilin-type N-terminal cleavage/methylation domain-containing protein [Deltaproteobacteria bacterium]